MISTRLTAAGAAALAVAACATAPMDEAVELPEQFQGVEIVTTDLGDGLYMLVGQGGNIGLSVGDDGAFMIDDQYAPLTPLIEAAVAEVNDGVGDVRFLINTHYHGDHAGGNEAWGGKGATIVAHDNVRERLMQPVAP
ncbi:MAG: MBL fold metallo-hydrolase, partial [Maricaulaceae bacterium]